MGFLDSPVGQEAGSTPLARVEPARSGDFKFTRVNKLSLKVSSSSSARGQNVTMLRSTTHVFGPYSGWSWLRISAIAKDFLEISRVSSSGVETGVVPQSLFSSTISTYLRLLDTPDIIQGLSITGHAIARWTQVKWAQRPADTNMIFATTSEDTKKQRLAMLFLFQSHSGNVGDGPRGLYATAFQGACHGALRKIFTETLSQPRFVLTRWSVA